jgi:MFS family permease
MTTEAVLRRNFAYDASSALGTGMFNALVVGFLAVIARREGAEPLLLAALAAAPFAANMLSIFSGFWVPGDRHRVNYVAALLVLGRAMFIPAMFTTHPLALLSMAFGAWLMQAMVAPLQVDIWRGSYPQRLRARVLGYLRVIQSAAAIVAAPLGGLLIERLGAGALLSIGSGLGMLGAAGFSQVRTPGALQPQAQRFTPLESLRVLHEQPAYRGLILAWVVWGLGTFMAAPLYALVLVDRFQAGYAEVGVLQLIGAASGLIGYLVLGQYLDRRRGSAGATPLGFLMVALVPVVYMVAPSLPLLAIAFVLQSLGTSVFDMGWQVALVSRVPDEHRLRYQAAHTSITGVRGVAAPFLGSLIMSLGLGLNATLLISGALAVLGALIMARTLNVGVRTPTRQPSLRRLRLAVLTATLLPRR